MTLLFSYSSHEALMSGSFREKMSCPRLPGMTEAPGIPQIKVWSLPWGPAYEG